VASTNHPLQEGSFDPLETIRRLGVDASAPQGIKLRVLWLRTREPAARLTTTLVSMDERVVVMSATIALPDGGEGSGHAAARIADTDDLATTIEATEIRAIGKALDNLGYVVVDQGRSPEGRRRQEPAGSPSTSDTPTPVRSRDPAPPTQDPQPESPGRQPPEHVRALRAIRDREQRSPQQTPPATPQDAMTDQSEHGPERPAAPPVERPRPRPIRAATPVPTDDDTDPALEDVSWTAFWEWARETYQLRSRVQLEEVLGQPVGNKPPGELRRLLLAHFDGGDPGES